MKNTLRKRIIRVVSASAIIAITLMFGISVSSSEEEVGGVDGLELMIGHGKIEIVHLGFIRGRDIKNSIIICSEAENMTKEHIQLLLGRVGEGSSLWINGDFKQCDAEVFRQNSGLMVAVDKLKGHPRFGYVKLLKTERSETAAMADLLD